MVMLEFKPISFEGRLVCFENSSWQKCCVYLGCYSTAFVIHVVWYIVTVLYICKGCQSEYPRRATNLETISPSLPKHTFVINFYNISLFIVYLCKHNHVYLLCFIFPNDISISLSSKYLTWWFGNLWRFFFYLQYNGGQYMDCWAISFEKCVT